MVEQIGKKDFTTANEMNIPVDIFLSRHRNGWHLIADNYMPRSLQVASEVYEAAADTREELVEIIKTNILPLYAAAVNQLTAICEGKSEGNLRYWEDDKTKS